MNLRDKKGSISIFVLVALLFMTSFLIISVANNAGKSKTIKEQFNIISDIYAYTKGEEGAYEKAYKDLREKNKRTFSFENEADASKTIFEDTSTVELTKTFEGYIKNYRIYGNSVQNGTPTPETPVEVKSFGEKTNNLFDISKVLSNAQIINNNNKSISIYNHACTAARPNTLKDYCPNLEVGKTYIISAKHDIETEIYQRIYLSGSNVTWRFDTTYYRTRTITQEDLDSQVIWYKDADKEYNTVWDIKIEEVVDGKEVEYEPYGKYKIPIKVTGKNLVSELVSGYSKYGNFPELEATTSSIYKTVILKDIKAGKYTFSFEKPIQVVSSTSTTYNSSAYSISPSSTSNTKVVTITLTQDEEEYQLSFRDSTSGTTKWTGWVQCEKGNVATEYEPYKEVITNIYLDEPLRGIGDNADYIDFASGEIVRKFSILEFTGEEKIHLTDDANGRRFDAAMANLGKPKGNASNQLSNRFILKTGNDREHGYFYIATYLVITDNDNYWDTVDNLSSWFKECYNADNPVYMIYEMTEEQREKINLEPISTLEDYTKIEVLTEVPPSKIEIEYEGYTMD